MWSTIFELSKTVNMKFVASNSKSLSCFYCLSPDLLLDGVILFIRILCMICKFTRLTLCFCCPPSLAYYQMVEKTSANQDMVAGVRLVWLHTVPSIIPRFLVLLLHFIKPLLRFTNGVELQAGLFKISNLFHFSFLFLCVIVFVHVRERGRGERKREILSFHCYAISASSYTTYNNACIV